MHNEPPEPPHRHGSGLLQPARFILRSFDLTVLAVSSTVYTAMQLVLSSFLSDQRNRLQSRPGGALLSASQLAGVAGSLGWGSVADRVHSPRMVLVAIAVLMAIATALMGLFSPSWPFAGLATVVIIVGGTASGWNGVYLAEIMSGVKAAEAGLATARSLMFNYLGGPVLFGVRCTGRYAGAYFAIAAAVLTAAF